MTPSLLRKFTMGQNINYPHPTYANKVSNNFLFYHLHTIFYWGNNMKNLFANFPQLLLSYFLDSFRLEFPFLYRVSDFRRKLMRIMKNTIFLTLLAAGMLMPTHAAEIPSELFGYWADESGNCAEAKKSQAATGMWAGMFIKKNSVGFIESSCSAAQVMKAGASSYTLKLKCSGEGEEWRITSTYTINGDKLQTLNDKGEISRYRRCSK